MSSINLTLTLLSTAATSTGIGVTIVNLANTNNENIEKKIEKLWEEIAENIKNLTSKISEIQKNKDFNFNKKYISILTKITKIADTAVDNGDYQLKLPKNSKSTYKKLQKFQKELSEVLKLLEESKVNSV